MKKIYNLFSLVVIINLMVAVMPFEVVMADGMENDVGSSEVVEDLDDGGDDDEDEDYNEEDGDEGDEKSGDEVLEEVVLPILYIRAVNPGYKVDDINNVGEMIEIGKSSDDLISLAGVTVRYTNSSGKETVLVEFPENSYMAGETLLLRFDSTPGSELSNITYGTTLALKAGPVALFAGDEMLDEVCWTNKGECLKDFVSAKPTTLRRNLTTGEFEHVEEYEPDFDAESLMAVEPVHEDEEEGGGEENDGGGDGGENEENDINEGGVENEGGDGGYGSDNDGNDEGDEGDEEDEKSQGNLNENPDDDDERPGLTEVDEDENENKVEIEKDNESETVSEVGDNRGPENEIGGEAGEEKIEKVGKCVGLQFSEILSYYAETQAEQFIELHNVGLEAVQAEECVIRYKGKTYALAGEVEPDEYFVRKVDDFKLTKNPTSSNVIELLDEDGETVDVVEYYNGQKKGAAWALVGYEAEEEVWRITYAVTPGEANVYQEFKSCEEGKVINEATGNCVKAVAVVVDDGGGELNDVEEGKGSVVAKVCAEGQYLNPLTGRCKKLEDEAEEKTCAEGYYLNEETGRCRKIVEETVKTCSEGYYLNEETGRCRKIVVEEEKTCAEGQYLNPLTGRCKKIEVEEAKTCAEGYYLNEETGRCKKIVVEEEKTCAEGYYLNEETGRCKKIVENNGADYELVAETYEEESSFVALYAVLGVIGVGLLYVVYEFRKEIGKFFRRWLKK